MWTAVPDSTVPLVPLFVRTAHSMQQAPTSATQRKRVSATVATQVMRMDVRSAPPANSRQVPERHRAPAATQIELVPLLTDTMQEIEMMILVMIVEIILLHWSSRQEVMRVFVILGIPRHQMHAISVRQIVIVKTRHL